MTNDSKVVPLSARDGDAAAAADAKQRPSALPVPLRPVREQALVFLRTTLVALFDNADDSLFEMADKAGSNTDQSLYFEAMRAIRLRRHAIEKACLGRLERELEELNNYTSSASKDSLSHFALDTLTLVQPDELEQTVAMDNMVNRVAGRNATALTQLAVRMNSLVKAQVDESANPLGPANLAQYFVDALAPLELDIKVRLIVLKLFERYVLNESDALYQQLNEILVHAGILPDLRLHAQRSTRPAAPGNAGSSSAAQSYPSGAGSDQPVAADSPLNLFADLVSSWRHASGDAALAPLGQQNARPVQQQELLQLLGQLHVDSEAMTGSALRMQIRDLLTGLHSRTGESRGLERVDDDVISLVSMLFDFILDDDQLPGALKALIGRLQLPVLRLAIADKSFFSRSSHPARKLINELARATLGWSDHDDLTRDKLHEQIEQTVERLLEVSDPQPELFAELHAELSGYVRQEQRRSDRLEQRTRDAEEGRARVDAARHDVAGALNELLLGRSLPVVALDVLRDVWSQQLQMVALREGSDSPQWRQSMAMAKALVASFANVEEADKPERLAAASKLREKMQSALLESGLDSPQALQQLHDLAAAHESMFASKPVVKPERAAEAPKEPQADTTPVAAKRAVDANETSPETDKLQPAADVVAAADPAVEEQPVASPEIVQVVAPVLESPVVEEAPELITDLPDNRSLAWVASLNVGSWFGLIKAEGESEQRCKLAAHISFSRKYIFVNRAGVKMAEFTESNLIKHYEQGLIRLLDDNQLFDRALESVIGNLRQLQDRR
ncbi:DUF1631 domain-containing protein [Halopseudomonas salegens]|uniref:Thymidine phosphorylase n=1 Tax=Halopseudomonas salegens TaxID=1434072 RepID=A0A1H2ELR9_9GAMM|nr:DUF1631 domain-containing protein [Halopseudomonas salegens]SDT96057.1 Protein of unknown function [Halopseudomonas salegens]